MKHDFVGAIADYTEVIKLKPDDAGAFYHRGFARELVGDLDGAMVDYTEAIRYRPYFDLAFRRRGLLREARGDVDGAAADRQRAQELEAENKPP